MYSKYYVTLLLILSCKLSYTQLIVETPKLNEADFITLVKNYHPISLQADLIPQKGALTIQSARGAFDPLLFTYIDEKNYAGKEYYQELASGIKFPTSFLGWEFKLGLNRNKGYYLNPENQTPSNGLWSFGLSIPLLQGVFTDQRRNSLQQAKITAKLSVAERRQVINNLLKEALESYWNWVMAFRQKKAIEKAYRLSQERLSAVKDAFTMGERAAIDTLEATLQVQIRAGNLEQSNNDWLKATLELSNFIWAENNQPLVIAPNTEPSLNVLKHNSINIDSLIEITIAQHPDLLYYQLKIASLKQDQQWYNEKLKPKLNVQYNLLEESFTNHSLNTIDYRNYKIGIEFSMPLFLRKERSDKKTNALKITENELSLQSKRQAITTKIKQYQIETENLSRQIKINHSIIKQYEDLLNAEILNYDLGESNLFMINSRETNLINAQLKLIEIENKYVKTKTALKWAAGILID